METLHGHVHNGVVVLEGGPVLPEGLAVTVSFQAQADTRAASKKKRIEFPVIHCEHAGSLNLTNERIAEILDEEDAAPRR